MDHAEVAICDRDHKSEAEQSHRLEQLSAGAALLPAGKYKEEDDGDPEGEGLGEEHHLLSGELVDDEIAEDASEHL